MEVIIKDFEISTIIGILEFERTMPQRILINAKFKAKEFVDYDKMCEIFKINFDLMKFELIEDAILYFEELFKKEIPSLLELNLEILKLDIIKNAKVGVSNSKKYF